ncbi:MAG: hypothetical protein WCL59_01785 [Cyanobium sp. ELA507]
MFVTTSSSQPLTAAGNPSGKADRGGSADSSESLPIAGRPVQPDAQTAGHRPSLGIPVADLVGLRFSVVHLRLGGYTLIGVWASEILGLLTSPLLWAIGPRLHYISQALDVSPLLVVGIVLVAFQGGLQRSPLERLLLPVLFGLLPLLATLHFLMAPASIANSMTLSSKQEEVNKAQLSTIEGQLDRAGQVLLSSQNLDDLQRRLDAIPGVRLSAKPNGTLEQARQEVRMSLLGERQPVRAQLGSNAAQARSQFVRRAIQNASLATWVGLMLTWMRYGAMKEMELSATYLAWVIVADPDTQNLGGLKALADFQKRCLATSYLGLIGRLVQKEDQEAATEPNRPMTEPMKAPTAAPAPLPQAPWEPTSIRSEAWRRRSGLFQGEQVMEPLIRDEQAVHDDPGEPEASPWEVRRRLRELERMRNALEQFGTMGGVYGPNQPAEQGFNAERQLRRPSPRQLRRHREAMERFAAQFDQTHGGEFSEPSHQEHPDMEPTREPKQPPQP